MNLDALKALATSVRSLSMDGVQKANSGHPGLPLGCADLGALLYGEVLKHNPADPAWINRDRFVLSAGHGSMFLYSLLHLTGYDLPLEELKNFRQVGSKTPGHPEYRLTPGVETTTGPLGAGFSNAVGLAMAERHLASVFNTPDFAPVDHYTYALAGDGCLMEGVAAEAASLAGHLGLGKLIVFYDSNHITIEGHTTLAFTENVGARFEAYGWQVLKADAYDYAGLSAAVKAAQSEGAKPSLIVMTSVIGYGSPNKAGTHDVHGAPLGADEVRLTKKALGLPEDQDFTVLPAARDYVKARQPQWAAAQAAWQKGFEAWAKANPDKKTLWDRYFDEAAVAKAVAGAALPEFAVGEALATRSAGGKVLNAFAKALPNLIGGSADLAPSNNTELKDAGHFQKDSYAGRNLHFGVREHGMGGVLNGLVLHGGLKAYGATFLVFADYMRPPIRLASIMEIPSVFLFTHDSIFVGEDGPTHQPVEHLASLRAIPHLLVLRPGDAQETAAAWRLALGQTRHPSAILLTRQNLKVYPKPAQWEADFARGGYVALEAAGGSPETVVLATGSEVNLALEAAALSSKKVRVVSVSSLELLRQNPDLRTRLIPAGARVVAVEAGLRLGWEGLISGADAFLGIERFGESGPGAAVAKHLGLTAEALASRL